MKLKLPLAWFKARIEPDDVEISAGEPSEVQRQARIEHYQKRNELAAAIRKDIDSIGCIYPSVGQAMYDEPRDRLSQKISHRILGDWPGDK